MEGTPVKGFLFKTWQQANISYWWPIRDLSLCFCLCACFSTRCSIHTLEANSVLPGGLFDGAERRGDCRQYWNEAQWEKQCKSFTAWCSGFWIMAFGVKVISLYPFLYLFWSHKHRNVKAGNHIICISYTSFSKNWQIVCSSVLDSGQEGSSTAETSRQTTTDSIVDLFHVLSSPFSMKLASSCCLKETGCAYLTPCSAVKTKWNKCYVFA